MPGPMGSQARTTIYYGPWQCNQRWMDYCQSKCTSEGYTLMGCIWLADIKTDLQSRYLGSPAAAGGRYAITHCCCDYPLAKNTPSCARSGRLLATPTGRNGERTSENGPRLGVITGQATTSVIFSAEGIP
jgi:hypothetical protein